MTRRDILAGLFGAALTAAATYYGGPIAGKLTEEKVVPVIEKKIAGDGRGAQARPAPPQVKAMGTRKGTARLIASDDRCAARDMLDRDYHRALLRAGVFPVTRHEPAPGLRLPRRLSDG